MTRHAQQTAPSPRSVRRRWLAALLPVALCAVVLAGCGDGRSEEAFCSTLHSEKERILDQLQGTAAAADASGDDFAKALMGLGASVQAIGELRTYFEKLAKVAPAEIQTEAEIVADKMSELTDAPELSLQGVASRMVGAMAISGQLNTLHRYAMQHCGEGV
jgi:hypothetical protein